MPDNKPINHLKTATSISRSLITFDAELILEEAVEGFTADLKLLLDKVIECVALIHLIQRI